LVHLLFYRAGLKKKILTCRGQKPVGEEAVVQLSEEDGGGDADVKKIRVAESKSTKATRRKKKQKRTQVDF